MRTQEKGITLIELMFATMILALCAIALGSVFVMVTDHSSLTEEELLANNAIRGEMSKIQASAEEGYSPYLSINAVVAKYSLTENAAFDVTGLTSPTPGTKVGEIILHLDEQAIPTALGGPSLDITGDGQTNASGLTADDTITMLPIEIRVTWQSRNGPVTISRYNLLARTDPGYVP